MREFADTASLGLGEFGKPNSTPVIALVARPVHADAPFHFTDLGTWPLQMLPYGLVFSLTVTAVVMMRLKTRQPLSSDASRLYLGPVAIASVRSSQPAEHAMKVRQEPGEALCPGTGKEPDEQSHSRALGRRSLVQFAACTALLIVLGVAAAWVDLTSARSDSVAASQHTLPRMITPPGRARYSAPVPPLDSRSAFKSDDFMHGAPDWDATAPPREL